MGEVLRLDIAVPHMLLERVDGGVRARAVNCPKLRAVGGVYSDPWQAMRCAVAFALAESIPVVFEPTVLAGWK